MAALEMQYDTIHDVIDSWEALKREKNYDEVASFPWPCQSVEYNAFACCPFSPYFCTFLLQAGTLIFVHLFEKYPPAKALFGFPIDMDPQSDALRKSRRFLKHATYLVEMLGTALGLLGPDAELLAVRFVYWIFSSVLSYFCSSHKHYQTG
jgi:hypothetical protein